MSTENGASVSAVIGFAPSGTPLSRTSRRDEIDGHASGSGIGTEHAAIAHAFQTPAANRVYRDDTLPPNDFLKDLHREKRRAERTKTALSLVLYRTGDDAAASEQAHQLLEALHDAKRETDFLGHVAGEMIAVLCPDTDEQGARAFMRKVDQHSNGLPLPAAVVTYPDELFEDLARGTGIPSAAQPLLASGSADQGSGGYLLKRSLDIAGSLIAIGLFAPLMLAVAAAVALGSPGPVIFKQTRLGRGGRPFTFYKFRSMTTNADDGVHRQFVANLIQDGVAARASSTGAPAPYKLKTDLRVTRVGKFIRKTSLDELPQFFNVLKGDMSIVGPRPPIPYETAHYQGWHLRRILAARPGITGLWQVEGRSRVTFNEMVRMDLRYIRDCSLALDLRIVLKTFVVVARCDGAV